MSSVAKAFSAVKRRNFLPADVASHWWRDEALPIGYDQTISQPYTVRSMLGWLDAKPGDRVLDIGSGSGWTAALLAHIVGDEGNIYAVERIQELLRFGKVNCERAGIKNVSFHKAGKEFGLPKEAPFDRILVSASAEELPKTLLDQLQVGGKLVIPIFNDIHEITKASEKEHDDEIHSGFVFVPLIEN